MIKTVFYTKKNIICPKNLLFLLLIFAAFFAKAQGVKQNELIILQQTSKHKIRYGCSESELLHAFGIPDDAVKYFYEMNEKNGKSIRYQKCSFYILNNKLIGFNLLSPDYQVLIAKNSIPITIGKLPEFPQGSSKKSTKFISYDIKNLNGSTSDQFLEITLNNQKKVESIILGDY